MPNNEITEGYAKIKLREGIFYNPHMKLCRDVSSLAVGTLPELTVCDGMTATGIRGIRYALENKNVKKVVFLDSNEEACKLAKENLKLNKLNFPVICEDFNHFLYTGGERFNFVEVDPFGSPVPFIRSALFNLRAVKGKQGFLSVTATDTAVLCGAQPKACKINYVAKSLDNFFCHETAVRILIGHIARVASPIQLGVAPLFVLSRRHFFKVILLVERGAKQALSSIDQVGYASYCPACFKIEMMNKPFLSKKCTCEKGQVEWAGPLWTGQIFDAGTVKKMQDENYERNYENKAEIGNLLNIISEEAKVGTAFYYDVHAIADKLGLEVPKMDVMINRLKEKSFNVSRTHFNEHAIRTNAPGEELKSIYT